MSLNTQRLGAALAGPGMDTRRWFRLAIIEAIKVDAAGAKADVLLLPEQEPETVAIGGPVVSGGGLYVPYYVDQLVLVAMPDGNANMGGVILGAVWDGGQPAPDTVIANPDDVALVGPDGRRVRVVAQGASGRAVLAASLVDLGDEGATRGVARLNDTVTVTIPAGAIAVPNPVPPHVPTHITNVAPITLSGVITSASAKVRSS